VVAAVDLDHEACAVANEVGDEWSDRRLAAEVEAGEGMAAELRPEEAFGNRRGLSQRARTGNFSRAAR
jgi:hypothetical protein